MIRPLVLRQRNVKQIVKVLFKCIARFCKGYLALFYIDFNEKTHIWFIMKTLTLNQCFSNVNLL